MDSKTVSIISRGCIAALIMPLLAVSCQIMDEIDAARSVTLEARMAVSRTAVSKIQPQDGSYLNIDWMPGDSVGVFSDLESNVPFAYSGEEPSSVAQFTGALGIGDIPRYAVYPYIPGVGSYDAVGVEIPAIQQCAGGEGFSRADIMYANGGTAASEDHYIFEFRPATAVLKLILDVSSIGGIAGESVRSVGLSVQGKPLAGHFNLDLRNGILSKTEASGSSVKALLEAGHKSGKDTAYVCIAPVIAEGDRFDFSIVTDNHLITFNTVAKVSVQSGKYYTVTLDLSKATKEKNDLTVTSSSEILPHFTSFRLDAADNKGYILDKQLVYKDSWIGSGSTSVQSSTGVSLTVDEDAGVISAFIPYLFNFSLVPRFTLSSSDPRFEVVAGGVRLESGVTSCDFSGSVQYEIVDTETGLSKAYSVVLENTGLPVVVLDQHTDASRGLFNKYLDMVIPNKSSSFTSDDVISIYDSDGSVVLADAACGFKLRGNFSSTFPKKSMTLKLDKKAKILGMAKHKRWCLVANYNDKTKLRNDLAFELARRTAALDNPEGGAGLDWQPHGEFVELVLNGRHVGNYYLCEQIRIDDKRVAVSPEWEDVAEEKVPSFEDCGYLLEFDTNIYESYYGTEDFWFKTKYCKAGGSQNYSLPVISHNDYDSDDNPVWKALQDTLNALDADIYYSYEANTDEERSSRYEAVCKALDMSSAAEYILLYELTMCHETMHPKSVYLHKDGNGKFIFGPVWDFDVWTFVNVDNVKTMGRLSESYPNAYDKFTFDNSCESTKFAYFWYKYLLRNSSFVGLVKDRWAAMASAPSLQPASVNEYIDKRVAAIRKSVEYDSTIWPLSYTSHTSGYPNGDEWYRASSSSHPQYTCDEAFELLKSAYLKRFNGMNTAVGNLTTSTNSKR